MKHKKPINIQKRAKELKKAWLDTIENNSNTESEIKFYELMKETAEEGMANQVLSELLSKNLLDMELIPEKVSEDILYELQNEFASPAHIFYNSMFDVYSSEAYDIEDLDSEEKTITFELFTAPIAGKIENINKLLKDKTIQDMFNDKTYFGGNSNGVFLGLIPFQESLDLSLNPQLIHDAMHFLAENGIALYKNSIGESELRELNFIKEAMGFHANLEKENQEAFGVFLALGLRISQSKDEISLLPDVSEKKFNLWKEKAESENISVAPPMEIIEGIATIIDIQISASICMQNAIGGDPETEIKGLEIVISDTNSQKAHINGYDEKQNLMGSEKIDGLCFDLLYPRIMALWEDSYALRIVEKESQSLNPPINKNKLN